MQNGKHITGTSESIGSTFTIKFKPPRLEKGNAAFYRHEDMVVAKYKAKNDTSSGKSMEVYVLSTAHAPGMGHTNERDKDGNIINKPTYIMSYNHNIGRVDELDQPLDGIDVHRKSYK